MSSDQSEASAEQVAEAIRNALEGDAHRVARLHHAGTTVRFRVSGSASAVTLLLDREAPELDPEAGEAEVEIELSPAQAAQFIAGELPMPVAVVSGDVPVTGPIRKYLQVDPILRGLLADATAG